MPSHPPKLGNEGGGGLEMMKLMLFIQSGTLTHPVFTEIILGYCPYHHLADEKTKAQRGQPTFPESTQLTIG